VLKVGAQDTHPDPDPEAVPMPTPQVLPSRGNRSYHTRIPRFVEGFSDRGMRPSAACPFLLGSGGG
jgi:hypothetical protein